MKQFSTGNEYISIPAISTATGGINSVGFVHDGFRSIVELHGCQEASLLRPVIEIDGRELPSSHMQSDLISYWVPQFTFPTPEITAVSTVFAPMNRRGFVCALVVKNLSGSNVNVRAGWRGCWQSTSHTAGISRPMNGTKFANMSSRRSNAPVVEFRGNVPVFAMALVGGNNLSARIWSRETGAEIGERTEDGISAQSGAPISYDLIEDFVLGPSEERSLPVYVGIGLEAVSAVASAEEMMFQGHDRLLARLTTWLDKHTIRVDDQQLMQLINVNSFYNYFYAQAITLDGEDLVLTSARSSESNLCGMYRDRDAMRWSMPAVLQINWEQARKMVIHAFTRQIRNIGTQSRFIDGISMEPGLALDQLCSPVRALQTYLQTTGDMSILFDRRVQTGINTVKDILMVQRNPQTVLFETLLTPSGDVSTYPYSCFSNVLAWRIMLDLGALYDRIKDLDRVDEAIAISNKLRAAIQKHFVVKGPLGDMFARSVDLQGNFDLGDDPNGSLKLLTHLGFCSPDDGVYRNTIAWINSEHNPNSQMSKISVKDILNDLISGHDPHALDFLRRAELDDGIACDWIGPKKGEAISSKANAACAGYLAYCLRVALNAFVPDAAAVQKQRRPTGTLYQPPPEMDQQSKKARV